jgi:hypothetical protein
MTISGDAFSAHRHIVFHSGKSGVGRTVTATDIAKVVVASNQFLKGLADMFKELDIQFFNLLDQRNLSGFIGEVFSHHFGKIVGGFAANPHPDGRPDILDVSTPESLAAYKAGLRGERGQQVAIRSHFNPFPFGGLEVKCTIGSPSAKDKRNLKEAHGLDNFPVGFPRIAYISKLTYWAHHTSCSNLIGLYYDYCAGLNNIPQIMAVMHAEFGEQESWHALSVGKEGSKKTSNTSLTPAALEKLLAGLVVLSKDMSYREVLQRIGVRIH